jgi:hypothetical protein
MVCSTSWLISVSSSMAMAMTRPRAGGDLLNVAEGLFVLEDAGGIVGVLGGDADDGEGFVDEGVGCVCSIVSLVEIEGDRGYGYLMPS